MLKAIDYKVYNNTIHQEQNHNLVLVLSPPGQNSLEFMQPLAIELLKTNSKIKQVLIWTKRNRGKSLLNFTLKYSTALMLEECYDLNTLLQQLIQNDEIKKDKLEIVLYGSSNGARTSIIFSNLFSNLYDIKGLILAPPTGGNSYSVNFLIKDYYFNNLNIILQDENIKFNDKEKLLEALFSKSKHYSSYAEENHITLSNIKEKLNLQVISLQGFINSMLASSAFINSFVGQTVIGISDQDAKNKLSKMNILIIHHGSNKDKLHTLKTSQDFHKLVESKFDLEIIKHLFDTRSVSNLSNSIISFTNKITQQSTMSKL